MTDRTSSDFSFNYGSWVVRNRRLRERGVGCADWETFISYEEAQLLMGGMVSIDESDFPTKGFRGISLRLYNPSKDEWAIYWINSSDGVLQPPVFGRFDNGIGVFTGEDMDGDRRILVRFEWSGTDGPTPRWCQSFSYDDGASWEDNWVMDFSRPS